VDFTPPQGSYAQKLKRVMALGRPQNQLELAELTAALGDDEGNIRWLASSALVNLGGLAVVKMLAAYLQTNPSPAARQEAQRIAGLLGETSEDEAVRQEVQLLLRS
jgi:HEAT repeat protein